MTVQSNHNETIYVFVEVGTPVTGDVHLYQTFQVVIRSIDMCDEV